MYWKHQTWCRDSLHKHIFQDQLPQVDGATVDSYYRVLGKQKKVQNDKVLPLHWNESIQLCIHQALSCRQRRYQQCEKCVHFFRYKQMPIRTDPNFRVMLRKHFLCIRVEKYCHNRREDPMVPYVQVNSSVVLSHSFYTTNHWKGSFVRDDSEDTFAQKWS